MSPCVAIKDASMWQTGSATDTRVESGRSLQVVPEFLRCVVT